MVLSNSEVKPTKHQRGTERLIHRKELRNAHYNPRVISPLAQKNLRESIRKEGLIGRIDWNVRTGNIIGGHQRISQLDEVEGTDDYWLLVVEHDLTPEQERRWNVLLNSRSLQGDYDPDQLANVIREDPTILKAAALERIDLEMMGIADEVLAPLFATAAAPVEVQEDIEKIKALKDRKKKAKETARAQDMTDYWCVLVYPDGAGVDDLARKVGAPLGARYVKGTLVTAALDAITEARAVLERGGDVTSLLRDLHRILRAREPSPDVVVDAPPGAPTE